MNKIIIDSEDHDLRLDQWVLRRYKGTSRSLLYKLIRNKSIKINGKKADYCTKLKIGDQINFFVTLEARSSKNNSVIDIQQKRLIEKSIIFSDDSMLILNKPYGMSVHGGTKQNHHVDTIIHSIEKNAGLVHRLDKETTGVLLMGKGRINCNVLTLAFKERVIRKVYWGVVHPAPEENKGILTDNSDDKISLTHYKVIEVKEDFAWIEFYPVTGRNHQIRKHCFNEGFGLVGDSKYKNRQSTFQFKKLHLHACKITFPHPKDKLLYVAQAPLPSHMLDSWKLLSFSKPQINLAGITKLNR